MKIFKLSKRVMGRHQGITLAPFCILIREDKINNQKLMKHELKHWSDQKKLWYVVFYVSYIFQYYTKGYRNISFEIEANKAEEL